MPFLENMALDGITVRMINSMESRLLVLLSTDCMLAFHVLKLSPKKNRMIKLGNKLFNSKKEDTALIASSIHAKSFCRD